MAELGVRLDLRWTPRAALVVFAAWLLCLPGDLVSENVDLSASYPPAAGVYTKILATGNASLATQSGGYVAVKSNASPGGGAQLIVPNGKIGVGTLNPQDMLEVDNLNPGAVGGVIIGGANTGVVSFINSWSALSLTPNAGWWSGDASAGDLVLRSAPGHRLVIGSGASPLLITTTGPGPSAAVGIGVASPQAALDINSDMVGRGWAMNMPTVNGGSGQGRAPSCKPGNCQPSCQLTCPPGTTWDWVSCSCLPNPCVPGNCSDTCITPCPPGQRWSSISCSCTTGLSCQPGSCDIVKCNPGTCSAGFNPATCACSKCVAGDCLAGCTTSCPTGQTWDVATCSCQATSACVSPTCTPLKCGLTKPATCCIWDSAICDWDCSSCGIGTCFVAGTPVSTPNGLVPIEKLRPGDLVYSADPRSFAVKPVKILATERHPAHHAVWQVTFSNGFKVGVTPNHPILDPRSGAFKALSQFSVGDEVSLLELAPGFGPLALSARLPAWTPASLLPSDSTPMPARAWSIKILSIEKGPGGPEVYNLSLDGDWHTYLINGIIVHNTALGS